MATPNSTNGSCGCAAEPRTLTGALLAGCDLDLPEAQAFVSEPPCLNLDDMVQLSECLLASLVTQPGFEQRRLETKSSEEFVL